jgi:hypothetical protein
VPVNVPVQRVLSSLERISETTDWTFAPVAWTAPVRYVSAEILRAVAARLAAGAGCASRMSTLPVAISAVLRFSARLRASPSSTSEPIVALLRRVIAIDAGGVTHGHMLRHAANPPPSAVRHRPLRITSLETDKPELSQIRLVVVEPLFTRTSGARLLHPQALAQGAAMPFSRP